MATALYVVEPENVETNKTELFTKTGSHTNKYVNRGTLLECDWLWTTGALMGMRKIVSGTYMDYFVKDVDLVLFEAPVPPTPPLEIVPTKIVTTLSFDDGSTYQAETTEFTKIA